MAHSKMLSSTAFQVGALVLVGAAVFLPNLGQEVSVGGREVRHAEIARGMVESGQYVVPYVCGRIYIDKPPLFNWIVAAFFRLANRVDLGVARLPSALCAMAAMLGIYILGRRWFTARAAAFAALIWATSWLVVQWGRLSQMDMMLSCLALFSIVLADLAATARPAWRRTAIWCGACGFMGAAMLSKGPIVVFFFLVAVASLWRARHGRWLPPLHLLLVGFGVIVALVMSWALLAERAQPGHLAKLLGYQFGEGVVEHWGRITLYFDQLLFRSEPWALFGAGAAYWAVRRYKRRGYGLALVPALNVAVGLAALTLVPNKRAHYMLPLMPMWTLFIGGFLDGALALGEKAGRGEGEPGERLPKWALDWPLLGALLIAAPGTAALLIHWLGRAGQSKAAGALVLAACVALSGAGLAAAWRGRSSRAMSMLLLVCALLVTAVYPVLLPGLFDPPKAIIAAQQVASAVPPRAPVADYNVKDEYLCFKLNRPIVFAKDLAGVRTFIEGAGPRYLVVNRDNVDAVMGLGGRPLRRAGAWALEKLKVELLEAGPGEAPAGEGSVSTAGTSLGAPASHRSVP